MSQNYGMLEKEHLRCAKFCYDFDKDGGVTTGTALVLGAGQIEDKALIIGGAIYVETAILVGAGAANISLGIETATDVKNALAKASWTVTTPLVVVPVPQTANTWILTTAARGLSLTTSAYAITAGKIWVWLYYFVLK
jgi:hypothetical protein